LRFAIAAWRFEKTSNSGVHDLYQPFWWLSDLQHRTHLIRFPLGAGAGDPHAF
jgi:hypothetical protein